MIEPSPPRGNSSCVGGSERADGITYQKEADKGTSHHSSSTKVDHRCRPTTSSRSPPLVRDGKRSDAVEYYMVEAIGLPAGFLGPMKADPSWEKMASYAHTLAYDGQIVRGTQDGKPLPTDRWDVSAPTSVVVGSESETFFHDAAKALVDFLANADYTTLEGQDHSAFWMAPDVVAKDFTKLLR